jgi:antitoxin component YwqK of YwqJK toxin-antitoxin module
MPGSIEYLTINESNILLKAIDDTRDWTPAIVFICGLAIILLISFTPIAFAENIQINGTPVNVYKNIDSYQPNEVIGMAWRGEIYLILDTKMGATVGKRYKIKLSNGQEGWVSSIYCELTTAKESQAAYASEAVLVDPSKISVSTNMGIITIKINGQEWITIYPKEIPKEDLSYSMKYANPIDINELNIRVPDGKIAAYYYDGDKCAELLFEHNMLNGTSEVYRWDGKRYEMPFQESILNGVVAVYQSRAFEKSSFSKVVEDTEGLLTDLKNAGYVNEFGKIADRFNGKMDKFIIDNKYTDQQKQEIFQILLQACNAEKKLAKVVYSNGSILKWYAYDENQALSSVFTFDDVGTTMNRTRFDKNGRVIDITDVAKQFKDMGAKAEKESKNAAAYARANAAERYFPSSGPHYSYVTNGMLMQQLGAYTSFDNDFNGPSMTWSMPDGTYIVAKYLSYRKMSEIYPNEHGLVVSRILVNGIVVREYHHQAYSPKI